MHEFGLYWILLGTYSTYIHTQSDCCKLSMAQVNWTGAQPMRFVVRITYGLCCRVVVMHIYIYRTTRSKRANRGFVLWMLVRQQGSGVCSACVLVTWNTLRGHLIGNIARLVPRTHWLWLCCHNYVWCWVSAKPIVCIYGDWVYKCEHCNRHNQINAWLVRIIRNNSIRGAVVLLIHIMYMYYIYFRSMLFFVC